MAGGGSYGGGSNLGSMQVGGPSSGGFNLPTGLGGGNVNQGQRNYIMANGKLPTAMGGGAVSQAQQNFLGGQTQHPAGNMFTGGYPMQSQVGSIGYGGNGGYDLSQIYQQMFGGGGGYGNTMMY
jgi:hypothetical protein